MPANLLPPMPNWPSNVFTDEPAHGVFRRIAEANGQLSATTFAATMGLNGRNIRPADFIDFCEQFPLRNIAALRNATAVVEGSYAYLRGEHFALTRDIGFTKLRLCPACVHSEAYHRNWFDLAIVTRCPLHGIPLVDGTELSKLAWWQPGIDVVPTGERLSRQHPLLASPEQTWDLYVLGRIGVTSPLSLPSHDTHPLSQLAYIADVLGLSAMRGWSEVQDDRLPKYCPKRGDALRKGFMILQNGPDAVKAHLRSVAHDGPYARLGQRTGITALFGGLRATILRIPEFALSASLRLWLDETAAELGVVSRKGRPVGRHVSGVAYTLNEVAKLLQVSPPRARSLVEKLGISQVPGKHERHWISPEGLASLQLTLANLTSREEACAILRVDSSKFDQLCSAADIVPVIRYGGAGRKWDRFQTAEINALRKRLRQCLSEHSSMRRTARSTLGKRHHRRLSRQA
jgi:hypothetical protein